MHKYDDEMIGLLSAFYDPDPYAQSRRGKDLRIKIDHPQLNIISGTTPSNLVALMPETAWEQGFTSRVIMVFSDEREIGDDFANSARGLDKDLIHDIKQIGALSGEFKVTQDYRMQLIIGEPSESHLWSTIRNFSITRPDVGYICINFRWFQRLIVVMFYSLPKTTSTARWDGS